VLDRSGKLISRKLSQSSGLPALDKEALATVAAPSRFRCRLLKWMTMA
jgi:outer membrane biosynthesis protein TonB